MSDKQYTTEQLEAAVKAIPCVDKVHIHSGGVSFAWPFHRCNAQADGMVRVEGYPALERVLTYALRLTLDAPPTPASVAAEIRKMLPGDGWKIFVEHTAVHYGHTPDADVDVRWQVSAWQGEKPCWQSTYCVAPSDLIAAVATRYAAEIAAAKRPPLPELSPDSDWAVAIEDGQPAYRLPKKGEWYWSPSQSCPVRAHIEPGATRYILTRRRTCGNCGHFDNRGFCEADVPMVVRGCGGGTTANNIATACPCWKERSNG